MFVQGTLALIQADYRDKCQWASKTPFNEKLNPEKIRLFYCNHFSFSTQISALLPTIGGAHAHYTCSHIHLFENVFEIHKAVFSLPYLPCQLFRKWHRSVRTWRYRALPTLRAKVIVSYIGAVSCSFKHDTSPKPPSLGPCDPCMDTSRSWDGVSPQSRGLHGHAIIYNAGHAQWENYLVFAGQGRHKEHMLPHIDPIFA